MYERLGGATTATQGPLAGLRREMLRLRSQDLFDELEPEQRLELLQALAQVQSEIALLIAEGCRRAGAKADLGDSHCLSEWLRHNCKLGWGEAIDRTVVADHLERLPEAAQALRAGEIGFGHLAAIAHTMQRSRPALFPERAFLGAAREESVNRFKHTCEKLRVELDPEGKLEEMQRAHQARWLRFREAEEGAMVISALMDQPSAALVRSALEPLARRQGGGDERAKDARLLDALVELCTSAMDAGRLPQQAGVRPHVVVTTTLETLLGAAGAPAADLQYSLPIPAQTVQRFACDCTLTRILLDSRSVVIDAGRQRRTVSPAQRRALNARDKHCRWPGCHRPLSACAAHHLNHWLRDRGKTNLDELALLCNHHHFLAHEGGWQILMAEGRLVVITPRPPTSLSLTDSGPPPF